MGRVAEGPIARALKARPGLPGPPALDWEMGIWLQRVAGRSAKGCEGCENHPTADRKPCYCGSVAEWFKALVLKTSVGGTPPWVRIPPSPPLAPEKRFSRPGCGQNFPLFSRVMRVGLLTGVGAAVAGSVLSGLIFSGPVNRVHSGSERQHTGKQRKSSLSGIMAFAKPFPSSARLASEKAV